MCRKAQRACTRNIAALVLPASEEAPGGTSTSTPMPLAGLAPWGCPQVAREPKLIWAARPGNCPILVQESEFRTIDAELRAMGSTGPVELVAVSSASEGRYPDSWTRFWQFPRNPRVWLDLDALFFILDKGFVLAP